MTAAEHSVEIDLAFLRSILMDGGKIALRQRGQMTAAVKADHTPVTEVDRQVEDYLIEQIHARYPDHRILSEESGLHASSEASGLHTSSEASGLHTNSEASGLHTSSEASGLNPGDDSYIWVIDPIDGTRSFATGLPIWGVSIGILRLGEVVAGGFYMPVTNEMYWGTPRQAFYNDRPMPALAGVDLESPLVFLAVPSSFHMHFTISYPRVRALGSTAAHLAYAATGAAVGALTRAICLWDIAGMLPVLAATGIKMVNFNGQPLQPAQMLDGAKARQPLLAALPGVLPKLMSSIHKI